MKIVITDSATVSAGDLSFDFLRQFGEVTAYDLTAPEQLAERIADADVLLCNKTPVNRGTIGEARKLRYIGLFATGFNNIDLDLARERNISVCNVPGYSTDAVAQLTFAFILELANRVCDYNKLVAQGDWIKSRTFSFFPIPLFELSGKTLGIVGYGSIGQQVGKIADAFNMNVLYYNRSPKDGVGQQVSLDRLLAESDIVTLHCPLNKESEKLINARTIAGMKDGAILINTARGAVVDENELAEALNSGKLGGAGIDVLNSEPMSPDCPLLGAKNCIITPHIAWAGLETRKRLLDIVEENIRSFLGGKPINNVVNQTDAAIRKVEGKDIGSCVTVIRQSFLTVAEELGFTAENAPRFTAFATTEERLKYHLCTEKRPMFAYVADGRIVGYYSICIQENSQCELNNLCVVPAYQHRGIGETLLTHAFETAKKHGCNKMNVGIVEENTRLKEWYEKLGFIHTGTKKYDFFPFTCGYMEKEII